MPFGSVEEIRRANERGGYHWFDGQSPALSLAILVAALSVNK